MKLVLLYCCEYHQLELFRFLLCLFCFFTSRLSLQYSAAVSVDFLCPSFVFQIDSPADRYPTRL